MAAIDKIIHQPVRLRIMSALVALQPGDQFDFTSLKKLLDLSDGNLGAHLLKLEEAEYIEVEKTFKARKPKTYVRATLQGRAAFEKHVQALQEIIGKRE